MPFKSGFQYGFVLNNTTFENKEKKYIFTRKCENKFIMNCLNINDIDLKKRIRARAWKLTLSNNTRVVSKKPVESVSKAANIKLYLDLNQYPGWVNISEIGIHGNLRYWQQKLSELKGLIFSLLNLVLTAIILCIFSRERLLWSVFIYVSRNTFNEHNRKTVSNFTAGKVRCSFLILIQLWTI